MSENAQHQAKSIIKILLVEDNRGDAILLKETFDQIDPKLYHLTQVERLQNAITILNQDQFDVVLLDLSLPDSHGLNSITKLKAEAPKIPIVVLTGLDDETQAALALEKGARDYLVKMRVDSTLLIRSIRYAIERHQSEDRLQYLTHYDALTDLPNRQFFHHSLNDLIQHANLSQNLMAVLILDLDRFKVINDTLGHETGDQLLQSVANRLTRVIQKNDVTARIGGDEFTVILNGLNNLEEVSAIAQRILATLSKPIVIQGRELFVTTSMGISLYPTDGKDTETLIKKADIAMYRAKGLGRNNFQFYNYAMDTTSLEKLALENSLRKAIRQNQISIHYQPVLDLSQRRIVGMEALVRWQHPQYGLINPNRFIPLAEEIGLISSLGEWVLLNACKQNKQWQNAGFAPIQISVNFSARQFEHINLVNIIKNALNESELDPNYLVLEITESTLVRDIDFTVAILKELKRIGVHISIDDFGTGYSALSYLKKLPIDTIKIDESFIRDITTDPDDAAITTAIIAMAKSLNLEIIAEGVESIQQLEFLRSIGCHLIQGYISGKPAPANEITKLLQAKSNILILDQIA